MTHAISKRHRFFVPLIILATPPLVHAETDCTAVTEIPQVECEALMALYNSTDGPNWSDSSSNNWNVTNTPCIKWEGVFCDAEQVTRIEKNSKQLTGIIPSDLGNLSNLKVLNLYGNSLTEAIPSDLGNLSNLISLNLSSNQLTGTIPPELGTLSNLTSLSLDENQLTGTIPPELGTLSNLTELYLWTNQLTGTIPPKLGTLSNLSTISLGCNLLTIPSAQSLIDFIDAKDINANWKSTQDGSCSSSSTTSAPLPPTALNATVASQIQINLSWTDNSSDETGFKVERPAGSLISTTAADVISYSDTGLNCGTTYSYSVTANNTNGDSTAITASATTAACSSTTSPTTSSTVISTPLCTMSDSDIINSSCSAGEQTFTKEVEVGEKTSVARVTFEGDVDNKGMISNSTVGADATLTGGKLTGTIINEGTIVDVNFVGIKLSGGTLSGTITNNSKVGGIIKDVKLAAGTTLKGGKVGGEITGDPNDPPLITAAQIMPGSILSNVRLSPTVELPENVELGEGVILPSKPPTLADFGLTPEDIAQLDAETLGNLEPAVFATLTAEEIKRIPPKAFVALKPAQIAEIQKAALDGGLTTEQFEQMPIKTLSGLTSENMGGLPTEVIAELTPEHLDALDVKEFKTMPSEEVAKLFTNLDAEKITPQNAKKLVPNSWQLNLETGALTPPVGAKLSFQSLPPKRYSSSEANSANNSGTNKASSGAFSLPKIPNLEAGLGIGGAGTPLMEETKRSLEEEDMTNFVLSQDENGILLVEGTGESAGILYTFIPDADNAIQVNTDKIPIGLSTSSGGFYTITTPDGIQYKVIPAPKNPVALSALLGGNEVVIGERGDVLVELPVKTRRGGARQVLIFDAFVEPAPEDICVELDTGETFCEFDNAPEHVQPGLHLPIGDKRSTRAGEKAKVVYPDGTAQTVRPTVLSPDIFIQEGMKIDGMKGMLFKADGTFYTFYQGNSLWIRPNFDVKTETLEADGAIAPSITPNGKGGVTYTIAIDEPTQTRRGGARQILIFDLFIEPAPEELCVELETGEIFCEFDNAAEHVQP